MDRLRSMEVFISVVKHGNFTAAADALDMSAVMVGKYIKGIEDYLRTRLFYRTTRKIGLTEAGLQFYEHSLTALEYIRLAENSIQKTSDTPQGKLRVSAPLTFGNTVITPLVADYLEKSPRMQVELILNNNLVDLVADSFDVAIRINDAQVENVIAKSLMPCKMVICAAPVYLEKYGVPLSPGELSAHRCLAHTAKNDKPYTWYFNSGNHSFTWPNNGPFISNDGNALKTAALKGVGLFLIPEIMVESYLANGELVRVLEPFLPPPRPVHLIYLPEARNLPKIKSFIGFVCDRLKDS